MICHYLGKPTLPVVEEKEIYRVFVQTQKKRGSKKENYEKEFYAEDEMSNGSKSPLESTFKYFRSECPDKINPDGKLSSDFFWVIPSFWVHLHDGIWMESHCVGSWRSYKPNRAQV